MWSGPQATIGVGVKASLEKAEKEKGKEKKKEGRFRLKRKRFWRDGVRQECTTSVSMSRLVHVTHPSSGKEGQVDEVSQREGEEEGLVFKFQGGE